VLVVDSFVFFAVSCFQYTLSQANQRRLSSSNTLRKGSTNHHPRKARTTMFAPPLNVLPTVDKLQSPFPRVNSPPLPLPSAHTNPDPYHFRLCLRTAMTMTPFPWKRPPC